jgi:hypothetical protein
MAMVLARLSVRLQPQCSSSCEYRGSCLLTSAASSGQKDVSDFQAPSDPITLPHCAPPVRRPRAALDAELVDLLVTAVCRAVSCFTGRESFSASPASTGDICRHWSSPLQRARLFWAESSSNRQVLRSVYLTCQTLFMLSTRTSDTQQAAR